MKKPWWQSRVLWFNCLAGVVAILYETLEVVHVGLLNDRQDVWVFYSILVSGVNVVLRLITSQAVTFSKQSEDIIQEAAEKAREINAGEPE